MKIYRYLLGVAFLAGLLASCSKEFERPPLSEPEYTEAQANITIAKLKSLYADIKNPTLIDVDFVIKGYVIGNDVTGNIYKQIYIQDETAGINLGVDQSSIYTQYRVGQEIFIHVKGLSMVKYGDQLQIGYDKTNANRIPWEVFQLQVHKNKWPMVDNVKPKSVDLGKLDDSMVNTLIQLDNVYFEEGGKAKFSMSDKATNRTLKDGAGHSIIVRNSNYANFAANELPSGAGTVVAVLSKFRSDWQLLLRSADDCKDFGQPLPKEDTPAAPSVKSYFSETFDGGDASARPKVADYKGYDNKTVKYSDESGVVSIRTTKKFSTPHLWFPAKKDAYFKIENIDTSAAGSDKLSLNYDLVANLYDADAHMNLNAMTVKVDGKEMPVPSQEVSKKAGDDGKVYTIHLKEIPAKKGLTIEFWCKADLNTQGLRLDNISITTAQSDVVVIKPNK